MKFIYPAVFRKKEDGGYDAHFPDLECCEASGETLDDAIDNANEAARTWITVELRHLKTFQQLILWNITSSLYLKKRRRKILNLLKMRL